MSVHARHEHSRDLVRVSFMPLPTRCEERGQRIRTLDQHVGYVEVIERLAPVLRQPEGLEIVGQEGVTVHIGPPVDESVGLLMLIRTRYVVA